MSSRKALPAHLSQFRHAIVAVDIVVFAIKEGRLMTLLLKLTRPPFEKAWALPGGLITPTENLEEAVVRHIDYKTGLKDLYSEQLYTFSDIGRDPRGRVVSVAHLALLGNAETASLSLAPEYGAIEWFDTAKLPELAYDHAAIIETARERLKAKLGYTNIAQHLLPTSFSLSDLQKAYEIVLGHPLDKRNFRKKLLALDIITEATGKSTGAFRPAQLYRFKDKKAKIIEIL